jgi:hypothetical protein
MSIFSSLRLFLQNYAAPGVLRKLFSSSFLLVVELYSTGRVFQMSEIRAKSREAELYRCYVYQMFAP